MSNPCWCGSRLAADDCHLRLAKGRRATPGQVTAAFHKFLKAGRCLATGTTNGCSRSINSHSISRTKALGAITCDGHVARLRVGGLGGPLLERVGWNIASTFRGFCAKHDDALFAPLEKLEFCATAEQCTRLAYRAICFELFQKDAVVRSAPEANQMLQSGISESDQKRVALVLRDYDRGSEVGLRDLLAAKAELDRDIVHSSNRVLQHVVFRFEGPPAVAFAGAFQPDVGLDGQHLQNPSNLQEQMEYVALNLIPSVEKPEAVLVLSWRRNAAIGARFAEPLQTAREEVSEWAPQLGFLFLENTYFSERWWDCRREYVKTHLMKLAGSVGTAATALLPRYVSDWKLLSFEEVA